MVIERNNVSLLLSYHGDGTSSISIRQNQARANLEMLEWLVRFQANRRLSNSAFYPLLLIYAAIIIFGFLANILIIVLILRQRIRYQLRHLLMINLSVSDLLLCLVTMPLTFTELVTFSWPLGNYPLLCKLAGSMEGVSVFCSTLTIASIAMDRYRLIIFPTRNGPVDWRVATMLLVGIWTGSLLLACPLFLFRTLKHVPLNTEQLGIASVDFCIEEWPKTSHPAEAIYSMASTLFQFLIPMTIIAFTHTSICARLRLGSQGFGNRSIRPKTHQLLFAIALSFTLCWIPINLFNLLDSFLTVLPDAQQVKLIVYSICHLSGMCSAYLNPILYGWLNHNLRDELVRFFPRLARFITKPTVLSTTAPDTTRRVPATLAIATSCV